MSFLEFNVFEDNYFFSGNDNNISSMFQDDNQYPDSMSLNDFPSFKLEEQPQQDISNQDNDQNIPEESKGIKLEEEFDVHGINPIQNDEDPFIKRMNDKEESKPKSNKQMSSTSPTSDKKNKIKIKKVDKFTTKDNSLPNYWRFDMVKKHFKTKISEYGTNTINELIEKSDLPDELKRIIHKPNSPKFTANIKVSDNFHFLNDTIRTIYTIGKESEDLQKQNEEIIKNIYKHFERIGYDKLSENMRSIKSFFEMSYKDLIKNFYDSVEFKSFKEDDKTKFYDEGTIKQEGFSLLENYGLITLFSMLKKKRRRD